MSDRTAEATIISTNGDTSNFSALETGLYPVSEAARLLGISQDTVRRWLWGNSGSDPLWSPQVGRIDGSLYLGFLDLTEMRFVEALRRAGVSTARVRKTISSLRERFGSYPLSSLEFKTVRTDGKRIYVEEFSDLAYDVESEQMPLRSYLEALFEVFDYSKERKKIERWWPLGKDRGVVLDPKRSMGRPIVDQGGVSTSVLSRAVEAEGSAEDVADIYEISPDAVRAAVEFERSLAA